MTLPNIYCEITLKNDFEIWEDEINGGISVALKNHSKHNFKKRSKAIKFIEASIHDGFRMNSSYPLDVLKEDLRELGEMKGLPKGINNE